MCYSVINRIDVSNSAQAVLNFRFCKGSDYFCFPFSIFLFPWSSSFTEQVIEDLDRQFSWNSSFTEQVIEDLDRQFSWSSSLTKHGLQQKFVILMCAPHLHL
jgi:hypothetical protein